MADKNMLSREGQRWRCLVILLLIPLVVLGLMALWLMNDNGVL